MSPKDRTEPAISADIADNSRRDFLRKSAAGVGAAVAAGAGAQAIAAETAELGEVKIPSIRVSADFTGSLGEDPKPGKFEGRGMSGAEVFAQVCKQEKLAGLFCCPGNYTVINALAAAGIVRGCDAAGERFCPDETIDRGQLASWLARAFNPAMRRPTSSPASTRRSIS